MKRALSFLLMLLLCGSTFAQNNEEYNVDSLVIRLNASKDTLTSVKEYTDQIAQIFIEGIPDNDENFLKLITSVLSLAKKINDKEGIGWANYNLAKFEIAINSEFSKALPLLLEGASFFDDVNNDFGVSQCYMQMGVISYVTQYYEDAIKNFELSLSHYDNPTSIYLMAISYAELNNIVKSKNLFHSAIKKFDDLERTKSLNECYMYLGRLYVQEGLLDSAYFYLNTALENLRALFAVEVVSRPYSLLSEYYFAKGELNVAETYALASIESAKNGNDDLSPIIASKVLAKLYERQGKFDKAYSYLKLHYTLKNENFEGGLKQKIDEIQTIFEFKKKNEEEKRRHQEEIREKNRSRNITLVSALFALIVAVGLWSRLRYVRKSKAMLQVEKDRSDSLLLNILPEEIAQELKEKGKADARDFEMVSILFTDFKGFTEQSAKLSAADLVNEINHCFEAFDGIMEKYGIEKIKTIGDAYMAAGGLPVPTDDSVKNTVLAALEMQTFISTRKIEMDAVGKPAFEMRVGIHTGPVVAGIVGVKKFQYDIWGDTVNTANRMENAGEAGKVNISQATYELLKDDPDFAFESRGKIEAKGKGTLQMYFVAIKESQDEA